MKHTTLLSTFEQPEISFAENSLLFLIPLVQTAWAHGAVSQREKYLIFAYARQDSIDERDAINDTLEELLTYQPSREFFDRCLALIADNFDRLTIKERAELRFKILDRCRAVAASAGRKSPLDLDHHISPEEKIVLERLDEILQ